MTHILALDIATRSGWARGLLTGNDPEHGSIRFGKAEASDNAIFAACLRWAQEFLAQPPKPTLIVIERMLAPQVVQGKTQALTYERLAGLHGIIRAVAFEHGIYEITTATVQRVRAHFIGESNAKSERAKALVIQQCRKLGWNPVDDNAGDALALFSYQCAVIEPRMALRVSPLFNRGVAL